MDSRIVLLHGPTVNGLRPAIDPLFQSAAHAFGERVIGIVLTGGGDDGTAGLKEIKRHGGMAIAQDPAEAVVSAMPRNAIQFVDVDHVMRLEQIAELLTSQVGGAGPLKAVDPREVHVANEEKSGGVTGLTCPECNGALWELNEDGLLRFRCRIGHIYSPDSLLEKQADTVDRALWAALRSLEERAALCRKMSTQATQRGQHGSGTQFLKRAEELDGHAVVLRDVISRRLPSLEAPDYGEPEGSPDEADEAGEAEEASSRSR
jgi:two-component system, chemotaxis family, protein-glutamate methylesterase/glutaminase